MKLYQWKKSSPRMSPVVPSWLQKSVIVLSSHMCSVLCPPLYYLVVKAVQHRIALSSAGQEEISSEEVLLVLALMLVLLVHTA